MGMSFRENNAEFQQLSMMDSYARLTPREQRFLNKSWAKFFGDHIFPEIDEDPYAVLYSNKDSRPNCPVNILIGALIIKEITGMSDDEILQFLMFDVRPQYALHTTSYREQPLSDRSLGRFRARCSAYEAETGIDLLGTTMTELSHRMAELMKIDSSLKRMDSMMVASNIKWMGRLELLYTVVYNMVKEANANGEVLPEELKHYTEDGDKNFVIYHSRSEETGNRINKVLEEAKLVKDLCGLRYSESINYQLLLRTLSEQAVEENGNYRLRTKEDGGFSSHILQNPADPDATFRTKAGEDHRGYVANVVEVSGENGSIIERYQYEQNTYSDSDFLKDEVKALGVQPKPVAMVTDGSFGSAENIALAAANNIDLITTNLTGTETPDIAADFVFSEDGTQVIACPAGHAPKSCSYNNKTGVCHMSFHRNTCENCPYRDQCKPKEFKKTFRKNLSVKAKLRAIQQRNRKTDNFKEMSHYRNGVESIPSLMRRRYKVDTMPVRGHIRTKMLFGFKVVALNFNRFCTYMQGLAKCPSAPQGPIASKI